MTGAEPVGVVTTVDDGVGGGGVDGAGVELGDVELGDVELGDGGGVIGTVSARVLPFTGLAANDGNRFDGDETGAAAEGERSGAPPQAVVTRISPANPTPQPIRRRRAGTSIRTSSCSRTGPGRVGSTIQRGRSGPDRPHRRADAPTTADPTASYSTRARRISNATGIKETTTITAMIGSR
jgi:hypothetical protein